MACMERRVTRELLEEMNFPAEMVEMAYSDLTRLHWWLGDTSCIVRALRRNPYSISRVLDIGCGSGSTGRAIQTALGVEVVGVDLRPPPALRPTIPIISADAARDPLPAADVAIAMHLTHHLSDAGVVELIRNVGRSCRRFVVLDLVRHWLPLLLFQAFVTPFLCRIAAVDGATSIRRAYTYHEMDALVERAIAQSDATFTHEVAPFHIRQVVDITFGRSGELL